MCSCYQQGHNTRDCPHSHLPPQCFHCSSRLHKPEVSLWRAFHVDMSYDAQAMRPLGVPIRALCLLWQAGSHSLQEPASHAGLRVRQVCGLWLQRPLLHAVQRPLCSSNQRQWKWKCKCNQQEQERPIGGRQTTRLSSQQGRFSRSLLQLR